MTNCRIDILYIIHKDTSNQLHQEIPFWLKTFAAKKAFPSEEICLPETIYHVTYDRQRLWKSWTLFCFW